MKIHRQTRPRGILWKVLLSVLPLTAVTCRDVPPPLLPADAAENKGNNGNNGNNPGELRRAQRPIKGQYIVVFNPDTRDVRGLTDRLARDNGGEVLHVYEHALKGHAATYPAQAIQGLLRNPHVLFIEEDGLSEPDQAQLTAQQTAPWAIDRIDQGILPLNGRYNYSATGAGVNVYTVDSGIRYTHREFEGRASLGIDFMGDGVAERAGDCLGHGTYVAALIAGKTYGAAKQANLISVRVFGCEWVTTRSRIIAGVDWITANAVKPAVVNMSLGETDDTYPALTSLDIAVENSIASGLAYTVSAGNQGDNACTRTPARAPSAITTGATTSADARADFSNVGSCVDVFAPGANVTSAAYTGDSHIHTNSGTSAAAPHVAGVAAMYLQLSPKATPAEVRDAILSQASRGRLSDTREGSPNLLLYSHLIRPVVAGMHALVDEFAGTDIERDRWQYYQDPSRTSQNDRLIVTLTPNVERGYGGLMYRLPHGFPGSSFLAEVSQAASGGPLTETIVGVSTEDEEEYVVISSLGGKIGAYFKWRGQNWVSLGEITFHPTNHRFRRVREERGTIYFEVSANGGSWTQPPGWTVVHGFTDIFSLHGVVAAGTWARDPNPGVAIFENVNTTVPAIPSGLTATAASSTRINLSWEDRSVNESGFAIERRVLPSGSFAQVASVGANVSTYADAELAGGTTYEYRVRAQNASGNSSHTNVATATTPAVSIAPAIPSDLQTRARTASRIDLRWTDNSDNESGFEIQRRLGDGNWTTIVTTTANATSYSDRTLEEATNYSYRIRATNTNGASSWSNRASATTQPAAPSELAAAALSASQIRLSWRDNSSGESGYEVQRRLGDGSFRTVAKLEANSTTFLDSGLEGLQTYSYRVRAYNGSGNSSYSNTVSATTERDVPPALPSGLQTRVRSESRIDLSWTDNSDNESGFEIQRRLGDGNWTTIATTKANATSYSDTNLQEATSYTYRIRGKNTSGVSSWSSRASATTLPAAATELAAAALSASEIRLSWRDNSNGETGFEIQRRREGSSFRTVAQVAANTTTFRDVGLVAGQRYDYRIRAYNASGNSSWSNTTSATP